MRRTAVCAFVLTVIVSSGSPPVTAQSATFRAATTLVPVFATVTDEDDRLVPDLTAGSFEVLDNGKPQTVRLFTHTVLPLSIVVLLDTSASVTPVLADLKAAAEQFVIRLLPQDQARIGVFNDRVAFTSPFTHDRDLLARCARDADFGNQTRLYDALAASLDALDGAAGRRVIVVLSDGEDTASRISRSTVLDRARAEDVMVYAVGFSSRRRSDDEEHATASPDPVLRQLAADTGGGYLAVAHTADLDTALTNVLRELHMQYLLAFAPAAADNRVHRIAVHVTSRSWQVRARRSYLAGAPHTRSDRR